MEGGPAARALLVRPEITVFDLVPKDSLTTR
jgi:hypothetical protein